MGQNVLLQVLLLSRGEIDMAASLRLHDLFDDILTRAKSNVRCKEESGVVG